MSLINSEDQSISFDYAKEMADNYRDQKKELIKRSLGKDDQSGLFERLENFVQFQGWEMSEQGRTKGYRHQLPNDRHYQPPNQLERFMKVNPATIEFTHRREAILSHIQSIYHDKITDPNDPAVVQQIVHDQTVIELKEKLLEALDHRKQVVLPLAVEIINKL